MFRSSLIAVGLLFIAALTANFITTTGAGRPPHTTTAAYQGPGDIVSGAEVFWSCQFAYTAAIAAAATQATCNLRRQSDNHTCDVIIATSGSWGNTANCSTGGDNGQTASSFCTSTTCSVTEIYDQTGNGFNASQSTAGQQPTIVFNAVGSNAVLAFASASTQFLSSTTQISGTQTQPFTYSSIYKFTGSSASFILAGDCPAESPSLFSHNSAANEVDVYAGTVLSATASDSAFHAVQGVLSGGSSAVYLDGTSTTGAGGALQWCNTTSAQVAIGMTNSGTDPFQGNIGEGGLWFSAFSAGQQSSMNSNQHTRWGF